MVQSARYRLIQRSLVCGFGDVVVGKGLVLHEGAEYGRPGLRNPWLRLFLEKAWNRSMCLLGGYFNISIFESDVTLKLFLICR